MKKLLMIIMTLVLALALAACGGDAADVPADSGESGYTLVFETTDINGNTVSESVFADCELTMINFWEPWCGPCVAEMPDLQKLSQDYADKGFQILGVYSTAEGVEDVVENTGVEYPILAYTSAFDSYQTGYVPNTIFVDSEGNLLGEPLPGARSYQDWAAIIDGLL